MDITLPTGLRGTIREMRGREAQAFVDPQLVRTNRSLDVTLANCWIETLDPGPYELVADPKGKAPPKLDWMRVLLADRFTTLIDLRIATFGGGYDFHVKCEGCDARYGWELDVSDLPRKMVPPESVEKIRNGDNRFRLDLPDGKVLFFKLPTGVEEVQIAKLKGNGRKLGPVDSICVQAIEVCVLVEQGGAKPAGVNEAAPLRELEDGARAVAIPGGPVGVRRYFEEVPVPDLEDILRAMQEHDGGVETKIETICEHCGWQQEVELPFQRTFWARQKKKADDGSGDAKASATDSTV